MSIESFYYPKLATLPDAWKRSSFTALGALWIVSNNFLTPSDCKIRKIKDLGSLKNSIIKSRIDLFNHQIDTSFSSNRILARVASGLMRAVALLGVFVFAAPLGVIWHLGNCVYHTVLWIKGEKQVYLKQHINSLFYDLAWSLSIYGIICIRLIDKSNIRKILDCNFRLGLSLIIIRIFFNAAVIGGLFFKSTLILLASLSPKNLDIFIGSIASFTLKEKFGLEGEDGWLLTFNQALDAPIIQKSQTVNHGVLSGYFYDLRTEQALKILIEVNKIIQCLQLRLEEDFLKEFSENPTNFLQIFQNSNDQIVCSKTINTNELKQSIDQLKKYFANYKEIEHVLSDLFPSIKFANFPFDPKSCQSFFSYQGNEINLSLLDNFKCLLTKIKLLNLSEGGSSDNFIGIKQNILNANDAYEVLGLKAGISKEACKKAYIKSVIQIHPDKTPENWKAQATELFKVLDAAYKYISSV
jgi:hypothetical protein